MTKGQKKHDQAAPPAAAQNSLLLLRLENLALLAKYLGEAGLKRLLAVLTQRLGAENQCRSHPPCGSPGLLVISLPDRTKTGAMALARHLHALGQRPVVLDDLPLIPVLTGLLLPSTSDGEANLLASGQQYLTSLPEKDLGQLNFLSPEFAPPPPALKGQIIAHFQPQFCCDTGRITGFEALARVNHPTLGLLNPAVFMPIMTDVDHDILTHQILRQGLEALKYWDDADYHVPTLSLNISEANLSNPLFATQLLWELDRQDIAPSRLVLELLENIGPVSQSKLARQNLRRLTRAGCRIDLDDFGIGGHASMDALRQLDIHRIKIDRSFIVDCDHDPRQQRMLLAMLALANRLKIKTLAEGVETTEEQIFLAQIGCNEVQGFATGKPMPLVDTLTFLKSHYMRDALHSPPRLNRA